MSEPSISTLEMTLREIAAGASFLRERADHAFVAGAQDETVRDARLAAWARAVSAGTAEEHLERLFEFDLLALRDAYRMIAPVRLREDAPLPAWVETLREIVQHNPLSAPDPCASNEPLPFYPVFAPFVEYFQSHLQNYPGSERLAPAARTQIVRALTETLVHDAAESLQSEFCAFRSRQGLGGLDTLLARTGKTPRDVLYRRFVASLSGDGLLVFLRKYPVLARIMVTRVTHLLGAQKSFLARLDTDFDLLAKMFCGNASPRSVIALTSGLSDLHQGGQSVIIAEFDCGVRVVYKPRAIGIQDAFNALVQWVNQHSDLLPLATLRVLDRETYGWVEFAGHTECADRNAVARFYERSGMLLALLYLLETTDCHSENVLACGEQPVLLDYETLLHHRVPEVIAQDARASALVSAVTHLQESVLRVGLLPAWRRGQSEYILYDDSALGSYQAQDLPFETTRVRHVNTDAMELVRAPAQRPVAPSAPMLNGAPVPPDEYIDAVERGFRALAEFLYAQRDVLLAPSSPLYALRGQTVRFVFRATQVYGSILKQAGQPRYLRDGAEYGIVLEQLARVYLQFESRQPSHPLLTVERRALQELDIPLFHARTDSAALWYDDEDASAVLENYFAAPGFDVCLEHLQALSRADLDWQAQLVETTLRLRATTAAHGDAIPVLHAPGRAQASNRLLQYTPHDFVAQAVSFGNVLAAGAWRGSDSSAGWIAPQRVLHSDNYELTVLGPSLYDGVSGIALFLAALARVTKDPQWRTLALASMQPIRQALEAEFETLVRLTGIGGAVGVGAILYALTRGGTLLDATDWIDDALRLAKRLSAQAIFADRDLDVIGGAAGGLLALCALYETTRDKLVLEKAALCAEHLMAKRQASASGQRVWSIQNQLPLTGFAHGASGIGYALLKLYGATREPRWLDAAQEAFAYEADWFDPTRNKWRDLRGIADMQHLDFAPPRFTSVWCNGAAGIGMARMGALALHPSSQWEYEMNRAVAPAREFLEMASERVDHVCCGKSGHIEFLASAGRALHCAEHLETANSAAREMIDRAQASGGFYFMNYAQRGLYTPGFFQGASGIGYTLLRLVAPELLPNVLLWE